MEMNNHRQDQEKPILRLDQLTLDEAWAEQADLVYQYGMKAEEARAEYEEAKVILEESEAKADEEIRKNPTDFGLDKTTEAAVKNAVTLHPKVRCAQRKVLDAHRLLGERQVIMSALEHRKKGLEHRGQLWCQGYFAEPKAKGGASKEYFEKLEKAKIRKKGQRE